MILLILTIFLYKLWDHITEDSMACHIANFKKDGWRIYFRKIHRKEGTFNKNLNASEVNSHDFYEKIFVQAKIVRII